MKKRVAIYYENRLGRSDGFPIYAWNLLREREDIEVVHLIPNGDYEKFGKFDAHIVIDWGEDGLTNMLPYKVVYPEPFTYFASDTHLGYDYRLSIAKKAEHVFVAQKEGCKRMIKDGIDAHLLYHGVEPRAFPAEPKAIKKYDVCFVGHLVSNERIDFLDRAFEEFPNFWFGTRLSRYIKQEQGVADDCADIFKKSKVVLNPPTKGDVNMRVFEALSTGSLLITQRVPGIEDMFKDGKHLALYDTTDEAIVKIKYYIEHEEEQEKIAQAGMEEVLKKHTYKHRLDEMLKINNI